MIYNRIKNIKDIVGSDAHSLSWPLGGHGKERRDYFFSLPFIKGHMNCQAFMESDPAIINRGVCDGFLTREQPPSKDEIETAALYSYQLPEFYGKNISRSAEIPLFGAHPYKTNKFNDNRRFVILLSENDEIYALIPKVIGKVPSLFPSENGFIAPQGNTLKHMLGIHYEDQDLGSLTPIGLWYTNSELTRTPVINIEDSWDTAMMTYYHPKLTETEEFVEGIEVVRDYEPEERKALVEEVIRNELIVTSRKLADNSNGAFMAAYNLHDYLEYEGSNLVASGHESIVAPLFGGPLEFLDTFVEWVGERFPNVKVCSDKHRPNRTVPIILASDRGIKLSD